METRISRWGNSRAVRVPQDVLKRAGIDPNEPVEISAEPGRIVITPVRHTPTLKDLLAQIKPGDEFAEVDYGAPLGREAA